MHKRGALKSHGMKCTYAGGVSSFEISIHDFDSSFSQDTKAPTKAKGYNVVQFMSRSNQTNPRVFRFRLVTNHCSPRLPDPSERVPGPPSNVQIAILNAVVHMEIRTFSLHGERCILLLITPDSLTPPPELLSAESSSSPSSSVGDNSAHGHYVDSSALACQPSAEPFSLSTAESSARAGAQCLHHEFYWSMSGILAIQNQSLGNCDFQHSLKHGSSTRGPVAWILTTSHHQNT